MKKKLSILKVSNVKKWYEEEPGLQLESVESKNWAFKAYKKSFEFSMI